MICFFFFVIIICFLLSGWRDVREELDFCIFLWNTAPLLSIRILDHLTVYLAHVVQSSCSASLMQTAAHIYLPTLLGLKQFLWAVQRFGCTASQSSLGKSSGYCLHNTRVCTYTQRDVASKIEQKQTNRQKKTHIPIDFLVMLELLWVGMVRVLFVRSWTRLAF